MKYMTVLLLFVLEVKSFSHFLKISGNVKNPSQCKRISSVIDSYSKLSIIHQRLIEKYRSL